jgi:PRC-barrel domain
MPRNRGPGAAAVVAVLAAATAAPALAQPATAPAAGGASPAADAPAPVEAGRLRRTRGGWRAGRLVGAAVYDEGGQRIGAIDDLILGRDGRVAEAVLSVGGVLGIGAKLVGVPYERLRFEERTEERPATVLGPPLPAGGPAARDTARSAGAPAPVSPGAAPLPAPPPVVTVRVVLAGATRDSLTALPEFTYDD